MATIYSNYSNAQLYELFRAENWHSDKMNDVQRQQALQELSDRDALASGTRKCPVEVSGSTNPYGAYNHGTGKISLNDEFVNKGTNCKDPYHSPIRAANLRAMNTIYHENRHSWQHELVERPPREGDDLQLRSDLAANFHGSNYIRPSADTDVYDLYRIQVCEKDANEAGEAKTMAAMKELEPYHNGQTDPNMGQYAGQISRSYQDSLERARIRYDDPHVEQTLQRAMNDNAFHDRAIPENQRDSYYRIRTLMARQEIDDYEKYMKAHPNLDEELRSEYEKVVEMRTQEIESLQKANEQSLANANGAGQNSQHPNPAGNGQDDWDEDGEWNGLGM